MKPETILTLLIGTVAMVVPIAIIMKFYKLKAWKSVPVAVLILIVGTLGAHILYFIEASKFGGRSYYGAVFLVPIVFYYFAKFLNIQYYELMDSCAPAGLIMLVIMKYLCFVEGCCGGRVIRVLEDGNTVVFPSQIAELINGIILLFIIMWLGISDKQHGKLYGWYLLLYGLTRFVLNFFREDTTPLLMGLPDGNVWSLISIAAGIIWVKGYTVKVVKLDGNSFGKITNS